VITTHSFLLEDAKEYGTSAAVILYHLRYLQQSKADKDHPTHEDKHWVNYTYEALSVTFPYLSVDQLKRIMKKLTDSGTVVKEHLHKQRFNRELYWHVVTGEIALSDNAESLVQQSAESPDVLHTSNIKLNIAKLHFEEFWKAYPKKADKKGAMAKFLKLNPEKQELAVADVKIRSRKDADWLKSDGQFVPNPTTYLTRERWDDEWRKTGTKSASGGRYDPTKMSAGGEY